MKRSRFKLLFVSGLLAILTISCKQEILDFFEAIKDRKKGSLEFLSVEARFSLILIRKLEYRLKVETMYYFCANF